MVSVGVQVLQHQALSHGQEPQQIELVVQEVKVEDDKGKVDTVILNRYYSRLCTPQAPVLVCKVVISYLDD